MGSTVIIDLESLQAYRQKIDDAINKLLSHLDKTEVAVRTVSESWKDNNFMQFQQNFDVDKEQIRSLCDVLRSYENDILYRLEQNLMTYESSPTHL